MMLPSARIRRRQAALHDLDATMGDHAGDKEPSRSPSDTHIHTRVEGSISYTQLQPAHISHDGEGTREREREAGRDAGREAGRVSAFLLPKSSGLL